MIKSKIFIECDSDYSKALDIVVSQANNFILSNRVKKSDILEYSTKVNTKVSDDGFTLYEVIVVVSLLK